MLKGRNDFQRISLKPKKAKNQRILSGSPDSCDSKEDNPKPFHFKLLSKDDKECSNSKSNKSLKPKCKKQKKNMNIINIIVGDRKIEKALKAYNSNVNVVKENKSNSKLLKDMLSKLNIKFCKHKLSGKDAKNLKLKASRGKSKDSNKESRNSSKSRCTSNLGLKKKTTILKDDIVHDKKRGNNKVLEDKIKETFKNINKSQRNLNLGMNTVRYSHKPMDNLRCMDDEFDNSIKTLDELTDTGICINFLDQLEFTERSCLSVSEPERFINLKDNTHYLNSFGLDEGLGEPEQESKDQKKICSRLKMQISKSKGDCNQYNKNKLKKSSNRYKIETKDLLDYSDNPLNAPLSTRNNKLINFCDYNSNSTSNLKSENKAYDFVELYDPAQLINKFKESRFHHHSRSGMSSEFQPLFPVKGPKILVEGEETQEDTPNQLLFCTGAKILSTKSNISLRCNTTEKEVANPEISIVPTQIEKRLQKLDETIEGIDKVPSSNSSHSEVEHSKNITVMSQKGRCKQRND